MRLPQSPVELAARAAPEAPRAVNASSFISIIKNGFEVVEQANEFSSEWDQRTFAEAINETDVAVVQKNVHTNGDSDVARRRSDLAEHRLAANVREPKENVVVLMCKQVESCLFMRPSLV